MIRLPWTRLCIHGQTDLRARFTSDSALVAFMERACSNE
jgi:hypothetical protein